VADSTNVVYEPKIVYAADVQPPDMLRSYQSQVSHVKGNSIRILSINPEGSRCIGSTLDTLFTTPSTMSSWVPDSEKAADTDLSRSTSPRAARDGDLSKVDEAKLLRKIDLHVLPFICIMHILAFLDRYAP
jgi:hypothetical protein